jgi:hypothetical protein
MHSNELKHSMGEELWYYSKEFSAYSIWHNGQKSVLIMNATLCKNNLNSVKDVPMMYISGERKKKKKGKKVKLLLYCLSYLNVIIQNTQLPLTFS